MKRVRIALEMDEHFVRMLHATVQLKGLGMDLDRQHTALEALGVVALAEARGAYEAEVHALTPIPWRPHLEVIHDLRQVTETDRDGTAPLPKCTCKIGILPCREHGWGPVKIRGGDQNAKRGTATVARRRRRPARRHPA